MADTGCGALARCSFSAFVARRKAADRRLASPPAHAILRPKSRKVWRRSMDFEGKVALITGAGNGIGRAAALAFATRGAKVVVVEKDTVGAERTQGTIQQQGGQARF